MNSDIFKSRKNNIRPCRNDIIDFFKDIKEKPKKLQTKLSKQLAKLQSKIQAEEKHAVLIIFQAMDAAGKDSTIRNVFRHCDIAAINNVSFKQPSKEESSHDFIWRCNNKVPKRGEITIFNRSYYEEVLVVKVHPQWLASQKVESPVGDEFWLQRYQSINNYEKHLRNSGTKIIKFMLDVSQEEQKNRFIRRYTLPSKQWKFSLGDLTESQLWPQYQCAFDDMLKSTSTDLCPWYVIPADNKTLMRLLVTKILIKELESLNPQYPPVKAIHDEERALIDSILGL